MPNSAAAKKDYTTTTNGKGEAGPSSNRVAGRSGTLRGVKTANTNTDPSSSSSNPTNDNVVTTTTPQNPRHNNNNNNNNTNTSVVGGGTSTTSGATTGKTISFADDSNGGKLSSVAVTTTAGIDTTTATNNNNNNNTETADGGNVKKKGALSAAEESSAAAAVAGGGGRSSSLRERERHHSLDKDRYNNRLRHRQQQQQSVGGGGVAAVNRRFSAHIVHRRESGYAERSIDAAIRRPSLSALAERGSWGNRWEFLLSCVGLSVGIGNVWRFPYLAYQNGGGAFLIPYLIMLALAGKPMYFLELAVGQFGGVGPLALWNCCPIARGVGVAMVVVSLIVCIYYNVIMSYTVYYMVASFSKVVPWSKCDPAWADLKTCYVRNSQPGSGLVTNKTIYANEGEYSVTEVTDPSLKETASLQYWERHVLHLSKGIEYLGPIKLDLALCLLFSWVVVVLCLAKGIKTSGKVVYFAATFPYVILFTLLVTGLMQEGALDGVIYFISPTWSKLLDIQVWQAAAGQMFFSLSVSMGGLIMYSSYNDFNNNVYRDALVVSIMDTVTSMISGIVTFSILGAMAHDLGVPIDNVVKEGPGLAFVAYPEALLRLPFPQLWSILFFLMLFILGLDSEFALLENVLTSLSDEFTVLRSHKLSFCIVTAVFSYIIGLSCVTEGGNYVLTLMDVYGGGVAVLFIAIAECISLAWIYGLQRMCWDFKFMLGFIPGIYWRVTWGACAPIILSLIFIYSMIDYKPLRYKDYDYPDWADGIGWCLSGLSILQIPFWAIVNILQQDAPSLKQKLLKSLQSKESWGPANPETKQQWLDEMAAERTTRVPAEDKREQYMLKSEVVAKLCQNEDRTTNQINGKQTSVLAAKTAEGGNASSYPGHYFSV